MAYSNYFSKIFNFINLVRKYKAIDVFSGAGGMSIGAEWAGLEVVLAVENDEHAAATYRANHANTKVIEQDIREINPKSLKLGARPFVLFGGPPCQGYSTSNTMTRNRENANNYLFEEFLRFVLEINPKWVVFENVEGFSHFDNGNVVKTLESRLEKLGYTSTYSILSASEYGVPQNRKRFFLVANRLNLRFKFPEPLKKKVTVNEALFDLPDLKNGDQIEMLPYKTNVKNNYTRTIRNGSKYALQNLVSKNMDYVIERYSHIGHGQNWTAIPSRLMDNYSKKENCHSGIYKRLDPNKPSVVISNYRKNMLIHPYSDRGLSVREAARLQSFPDKFIFKGPLMYIQQQIGNAVPPLLALAVFKQIITCHNARTKRNRKSR